MNEPSAVIRVRVPRLTVGAIREERFRISYEQANHSPLNTRPDFFVGREAADQTKC